MVQRHPTPTHGFTLVELLMVIAIVVLLLALLMPMLGQARDAAVSVQCQANLRGLTAGLLTYATENRGVLVPAVYSDDDPATDEGLRRYWSSWLGQYGSPRYSATYFCPSTPPTPPDVDGWNDRMFAYGMRAWTLPDLTLGSSKPKKLRSVDSPDAFFIFADSYHGLPSIRKGWYKHMYGTVGGIDATVHRAHAKAANTAFLDMHVKAIGKRNYFEQEIAATQSKYSGGLGYGVYSADGE